MVRICLFAIALAVPATASARDYGQQGTVFPIIERDLLEQILARLTAMERSGETARLNEDLKPNEHRWATPPASSPLHRCRCRHKR